MRPHNKSTLWDEYLEHYDKHYKYFNTKHKKAFCKRCISKAIEDADASPETRAKFEATGFVEGWTEWKYRHAFERVEAISGRSSNMQRHIRTCDYITAEDRARIMANFEASQAASRASREPEAERTLARIGGPLPQPWSSSASPYSQVPSLSSRGRATSNSDDDGTSSSSIPSPNLARREPLRPVERTLVSPTKPSPKLSLRSILNDDSEGPSYPYSSSSSTAAKGKSSRLTSMSSFDSPTSTTSSELTAEHGLVARLDHAIDEIQHVRTCLDHQTGPQGGVYPASSEETIAWLRRRVEEVHQENERLKRRISTTENVNGELKAKLERAGEKLRLLEAESGRMTIGLFGGTSRGNSFRMMTPRSNSAPVSGPNMELEALKRRRIGESRSEASGFVPINR